MSQDQILTDPPDISLLLYPPATQIRAGLLKANILIWLAFPGGFFYVLATVLGSANNSRYLPALSLYHLPQAAQFYLFQPPRWPCLSYHPVLFLTASAGSLS